MHRGGVARGHAATHAASNRLGRHHLDKPRVVVVGFVAMNVNEQAEFFSQVEGELHRLDTVFAGELVVRDAADDVGAELGRLAHKFTAAVERHDAELRKCDQLQIDLPAGLFTNLDQCAKRGQRRVAHVDVTAHVLHAVRQLPAQYLAHAGLHVVRREVFDPLAPDRDAFEQRAR